MTKLAKRVAISEIFVRYSRDTDWDTMQSYPNFEVSVYSDCEYDEYLSNLYRECIDWEMFFEVELGQDPESTFQIVDDETDFYKNLDSVLEYIIK